MKDFETILSKYEMNHLTVEHKVTEFELMSLREKVPTYADEIKSNLTKRATSGIINKMTFTKRTNIDDDTHHFIGRVWVFTNEELTALLKEAKNV